MWRMRMRTWHRKTVGCSSQVSDSRWCDVIKVRRSLEKFRRHLQATPHRLRHLFLKIATAVTSREATWHKQLAWASRLTRAKWIFSICSRSFPRISWFGWSFALLCSCVTLSLDAWKEKNLILHGDKWIKSETRELRKYWMATGCTTKAENERE